jgi:hypothetical protein
MHAAPFETWLQSWMELARYKGSHLPDPTKRIQQTIDLWTQDMPTGWQRQDLPKHRFVPNTREYTRGNPSSQKEGSEHELEKELFLAHRPTGAGILFKPRTQFIILANAYPLAIRKTVEADALGFATGPAGNELFVIEIKTRSNNAWYAGLESLRQLKLLTSALAVNWKLIWETKSAFIEACAPGADASTPPKVTGLVLAPPSFYNAPGQKAHATPIALRLARELEAKTGARLQFAEWHREAFEIRIKQ